MAFYFNFIWLKPFINFSYPPAKAGGNSAKTIQHPVNEKPRRFIEVILN